MENYGFSYPDSGDSSPRSRDIDFDYQQPNPPPPNPNNNNKLKFMVSYGGKIQPRPQGNLLSYVGGDTKILSVDRSIKFSSLLSKLSSLLDNNDAVLTSFKYQLPGEDLDSLISVTNDDDVDHLIHEFDRLNRSSTKPFRLRIFLFPVQETGFGLASSERDRFAPQMAAANVDFLFGLDNVLPSKPLDPVVDSEELNRVQILGLSRPNSDDNLVAADALQKPSPAIPPLPVRIPTGYWAGPIEHQHQPQQQQQQAVYMIHAPPPAAVYHAPVIQPVSSQAFYHVQRVPSDPNFQQQVFSMPPPPATTVPAPTKIAGFTEGVGALQVRTVAETGYGQVAYDSATGRQVYYAAPPGGHSVITAPFQGVAAAAGLTVSEGKAVPKVSPTSATP